MSAAPGRSTGWVRLRWSPSDGVTLVSGNSSLLLGVSARRLIDSGDPLPLLPSEVSAPLAAGIPDVPMMVSTGSLVGSITPTESGVDVVLFETPDPGAGGGALLEDLGAGVVGTDRTGAVQLWNRSMSSIFRIPPRNAIGKRLQDILVQPLLYSWDSILQMALDGRRVRVEIRPDVQRRIECTFTRGGPGVLGVCFDTTESFQTERRLRIGRRMNQAYFNSVDTGLVLFDRDYRILVSNRAFGDMFGLMENLLGIHLYEILPRESFAVVQDQTRALFSGGVERTEEPRMVRFALPDGRTRVVSQTASPVVEDSGEVVYAVGIFEDMTELTEARDVQRLLVERFSRLAELSGAVEGTGLPLMQRAASVLAGALGASALAVYVFDPLMETELVTSTGSWPSGAPEAFSELRITSVGLDSEAGCLLERDESGILASWFERCLVFPLHMGRKAGGYIIAADPSPVDTLQSARLPELSSLVLGLMLGQGRSETEKEHLSLLLDKQRKLTSGIISILDVPAAVFRSDWSVLDWNAAMSSLTGIPREIATARIELAAGLLFEEVGGLNGVRDLARRGLTSFPRSWTVQDAEGERRRCAWRLAGGESAEEGSLEPVIVLVGIEVGEDFSLEAAREAAETYTALSRGTSSLLGASTRERVVDVAASTFLDVSGASRVSVEIRGRKAVSRAARDPEMDAAEATWTLDLRTETESLGRCVFQGGGGRAELSGFAENVARTYLSLERGQLGRRFETVADRAAGRFLITDTGGRILLSSWTEATGGAVYGGSIQELFPPQSDMARTVERVLGRGRLDTAMSMPDGGIVPVTSVALDGHEGEPLLFWWPARSSSYERRRLCREHASAAQTVLNELTDRMSQAIGSGMDRVLGVLDGDHPVVPVMNTARYAFRELEDAVRYSTMLRRALLSVPGSVSPERLMSAVDASFVEEGLQPPQTDPPLTGSEPDVRGDAGLLAMVVRELCRTICSDAPPMMSIQVRSVDALPMTDALPASGSFVGLTLMGPLSLGTADMEGILSDDSPLGEDFVMERENRLRLLDLVLRMNGGCLLPWRENEGLMMVLPVV